MEIPARLSGNIIRVPMLLLLRSCVTCCPYERKLLVCRLLILQSFRFILMFPRSRGFKAVRVPMRLSFSCMFCYHSLSSMDHVSTLSRSRQCIRRHQPSTLEWRAFMWSPAGYASFRSVPINPHDLLSHRTPLPSLEITIFAIRVDACELFWQ